MQRIRILYSKKEPIQFTGALDMQKIWERTFRRARAPLAYSQGFHPQPRLNMACPLPLGFTSDYEILDAWLDTESADLPATAAALQQAAPAGIGIKSIFPVELSSPSIQTISLTADYQVTSLDDQVILEPALIEEKLLHPTSILRERRGKPYDLKPLIQGVDLHPRTDGAKCRLDVCLSAREGATGRPNEVILALGLSPFEFQYHRVMLHFSTPVTL
ncbi:MAG TPA: TIGR03936 family radical SAM-associated protein [Longilinea sp.]|nr:TIGR03936 family radical SAM-associated protein [Longilinea sp.]